MLDVVEIVEVGVVTRSVVVSNDVVGGIGSVEKSVELSMVDDTVVVDGSMVVLDVSVSVVVETKVVVVGDRVVDVLIVV